MKLCSKIFFLTILFIFSGSAILAQVVKTAWAKHYNGPSNKSDILCDIAVDTAVGQTKSGNLLGLRNGLT